MIFSIHCILLFFLLHFMSCWFYFSTFYLTKNNQKKSLLLIKMPSKTQLVSCFTNNNLPATPVIWCKNNQKNYSTDSEILVIVNAGNANAATGIQGEIGLLDVINFLHEKTHIPYNNIFFCSTGVIGEPFPSMSIIHALHQNPWKWNTSLREAASAIMTTDKKPKYYSRCTDNINVYGICKGSGMICPSMSATMLAFLFIDVVIEKSLLRNMFNKIIEKTFNRISVDGDQSTNDSILLFSQDIHKKKHTVTKKSDPLYTICYKEIYNMCHKLSLNILRDGEGVNRIALIYVHGCRNEMEAKNIAQTIAKSLLVKTCIHGEEMNWGRFIAAIGNSKVNIKKNDLTFSINNIIVFAYGEFYPDCCKYVFMKDDFHRYDIHLHQGQSSYYYYTSDLSHEYISINSSYIS